jgi:hypothetical protein
LAATSLSDGLVDSAIQLLEVFEEAASAALLVEIVVPVPSVAVKLTVPIDILLPQCPRLQRRLCG